MAGWASPDPQWSSLRQDDLSCWTALPAVREVFSKTLEAARADKTLGSSLEASVTLHVQNPAMAAWLSGLNAADELKYLLITSGVTLVDSAEAAAQGALASSSVDTGAEVAGLVTEGVRKAPGVKCARCWMYSTQVGALSPDHPELCERCTPVVEDLGFKLPGSTTTAAAAAEQPAAEKATAAA